MAVGGEDVGYIRPCPTFFQLHFLSAMASQPSTINDPATASAADVDTPMTSAQDPTPARAESVQPPKKAPRVRAVHARNLDTISGAEELVASVACAIDGPSPFPHYS